MSPGKCQSLPIEAEGLHAVWVVLVNQNSADSEFRWCVTALEEH